MRTIFLAVLLAAGPVAAEVGGGDVVFRPKGADQAVFSHQAHVAGARLGCKECHPRLYLDVARSKRATMKQMEKGKSCGACHQGTRAFALDDCTKCHE